MTDHTPDLVLASASPRRRELLGRFGVPFRTIVTEAEEQEHAPAEIVALLPPAPLPAHDHPTLRAWRKADAACASAPDSVIIAADTVVVLGDKVLNKPADAADARAMLRRLSGRTHTVYTGLCVMRRAAGDEERPRANGEMRDGTSVRWALIDDQWLAGLGLVASDVAVNELTDAEIAGYVATGEPLDKAGAYGIQGVGGRLVRGVSGSYTSVVGLPVVALHHLLVTAGVVGLNDPTEVYRRWMRDQGKEPLACPPTFP